MKETRSFFIPHPSSLIPHPSSLIPHPSSLIPHPSSLIPHPSGAARAEPADNREEHRRQEDAEQSHADHAGEDRRTQRAAHLGAGPLGDYQREHAEDERERRHE